MNELQQLIVHHGNQSHATGSHVIRALRELGVDVICEGAGHPRRRRAADKDTPLLWIESGRASFPEPNQLATRPSAAWIIDTHRGLEWRGPLASAFDACFVAQKTGVDALNGYGANASWLPLATFGENIPPPDGPRSIALTFVGHVANGSRREQLLDAIALELPLRRNRGYVPPTQMLALYEQSRIVVNIPLARDLNMRLFEAAGAGAYVVTGPMDGLDRILPEGLVTVVDSDRSDDWVRALSQLLSAPDLGERAAAAAGVIAGGHRYSHRAQAILCEFSTMQRREISLDTRRRALLDAAIKRHAVVDAWRIAERTATGRLRLAARVGGEVSASFRRRLVRRGSTESSDARDEL